MDHDTLFNESIARVTGDDVQTVAAHGFQPLAGDDDPLDDGPADNRPPLVIDWDTHQPRSQRRLLPLHRAA